MTIEIEHRYGGHGGIATEWELTTSDPHLKLMLLSLPTDLFPVQHYCQDKNIYGLGEYYAYWIILPEGLDDELVGKVVIAFESANEARLILLLRECQEIGKDYIAEKNGEINEK